MKKVIVEFLDSEKKVAQRKIEADNIHTSSGCLVLREKGDSDGTNKTVAIFFLENIIGAYFESEDLET